VRAPWSASRACLHARDGAGGRGRTQRCDRRSAAARLCHFDCHYAILGISVTLARARAIYLARPRSV
jgi:hypothetical protein